MTRPRTAELAGWTIVLVVAAVARFAGLGWRAMSHDESMHALFAFKLANTGAYRHDPVYHGPLLYYINAIVYWLAGPSDATARVAPAAAGLGVVAAAAGFRRYIGSTGALTAGAMMAVSPTLLVYSRYLGADIYVVLLSLLWGYAIFRYLEDRGSHWLTLLTLAMAASFLAKEVAFMFGAIVGLFCVGLAAWRASRCGERPTDSPAADLAILMLTLVLPFTGAPALSLLRWDANTVTSPRALIRSDSVVLGLFGVATLLAVAWFGRGSGRRNPARRGPSLRQWTGLMALFWALQFLFFSTFLANIRAGMTSGVVGSLGYWLGQHSIARGEQPWFYYALLAALYEFLPVLLAVIAGTMWLLHPARPESACVRGDHLDVRRVFLAFVVWWTAGSWMLYSVAGEKMPWLLTHLVPPLCLAGGYGLARVVAGIDWHAVGAKGMLVLVVTPLIVARIVADACAIVPLAGRAPGDPATAARWLAACAVAMAIVILAARALRAVPWTVVVRILLIGVVGIAGVLTLRAAILLTFVNYDDATELLVYAHSTPDIKRALTEIETLSQRTVGDHDLEIAYDDESTWPFAWYLRDYPNARYYGMDPTATAMAAPVIIVGSKNADKVWPFVARGYVQRSYRLLWWPIEDYKHWRWADVRRAIYDREVRARLWNVVAHRRYPGITLTEWPNRKNFALYVARDVASRVWLGNGNLAVGGQPRSPVRAMRSSSVAIYTGTYDGKRLRRPTGLAVAPDGARVIADAGNDRVLVLNRDGTLRFAFGSRCVLAEGKAAGCLDPDGPGPLMLGDGQFNEPWAVAVSALGHIYVADTWNGRIQVFDHRGRFLRAWGRSGASTGGASADLLTLFGPRGLAFDADGNLLVADTGNKRLLRFRRTEASTPDVSGVEVRAGFSEPVGLLLGPPAGSIYVAETWGRRIQRLDPDLQRVAQWPIPGWESRDPVDKPYLALDGSGWIYATDPERARVLVLAPDGEVEASLSLAALGGNAPSRPLGLAVDPVTRTLLVADWANDRVVVFPTYDRDARADRSATK